MTARAIGVFTIQFPDPAKIDYVNNKFNTLNQSQAFQYPGITNIQTLSTKGVDAGSDPYGILYLPDLASDDCRREEAQHVPANATRIANLPADQNYALIAFAPWFSSNCTLEYFTAARQLATTKGFLTYLPGTSNAQPPVLNNAAWDLQDGGMWQQQNTFPTYALSSSAANIVMTQLNRYSGNLSTVPRADDLARLYNETDYVRLWASVSIDAAGTLPSLWVFLVIVLAILIAAIATTSLCMHIIQRRRRNALRQRVLNGQVDLEALGIKRLTVPPQILEKLPIITYTASLDKDVEKSQLPAVNSVNPSGSPANAVNPVNAVNAETGSKPTTALSSTAEAETGSKTNTFSQPTCPICIDDFEPNQTQVRELPCRHIFHPDCIDTFLLRNSSLCPMCKQSVLPPGALPVKITNMMVRRERHITRLRARSAWSAENNGLTPPATVTLADHARRVPGAFNSLGRRVFTPSRTNPTSADIEMGTAPTQTVQQPGLAPQPPLDCDPPTPTQNRREWARQRALNLLGNRHPAVGPAAGQTVPEQTLDIPELEERQPKWRQALTKVFPGFR